MNNTIPFDTRVVFPSPVSLRLALPKSPRPRVAGAVAETAVHSFSSLPLHVRIDPLRREILAWLPPIPGTLPLYTAEDFAAASADTMEDHAARVLQILGSDPAATLQALIDGTKLPDPPKRVPREIPNWRGKVVLSQAGHLEAVEAFLAALPEPQRTVALAAWTGDAKLARNSQTVLAIAAHLGLSSAEIDSLFIAAEALQI